MKGWTLALFVAVVAVVYVVGVYGLDTLRRRVLGDERVMWFEVSQLVNLATPYSAAVDNVSRRHGWPRWYVARVTAPLAVEEPRCFEERRNPWKVVAGVVGTIVTAVVSVIATPVAGLVTGTVTGFVAAGQPRTVRRKVAC